MRKIWVNMITILPFGALSAIGCTGLYLIGKKHGEEKGMNRVCEWVDKYGHVEVDDPEGSRFRILREELKNES